MSFFVPKNRPFRRNAVRHGLLWFVTTVWLTNCPCLSVQEEGVDSLHRLSYRSDMPGLPSVGVVWATVFGMQGNVSQQSLWHDFFLKAFSHTGFDIISNFTVLFAPAHRRHTACSELQSSLRGITTGFFLNSSDKLDLNRNQQVAVAEFDTSVWGCIENWNLN